MVCRAGVSCLHTTVSPHPTDKTTREHLPVRPLPVGPCVVCICVLQAKHHHSLSYRCWVVHAAVWLPGCVPGCCWTSTSFAGPFASGLSITSAGKRLALGLPHLVSAAALVCCNFVCGLRHGLGHDWWHKGPTLCYLLAVRVWLSVCGCRDVTNVLSALLVLPTNWCPTPCMYACCGTALLLFIGALCCGLRQVGLSLWWHAQQECQQARQEGCVTRPGCQDLALWVWPGSGCCECDHSAAAYLRAANLMLLLPQ